MILDSQILDKTNYNYQKHKKNQSIHKFKGLSLGVVVKQILPKIKLRLQINNKNESLTSNYKAQKRLIFPKTHYPDSYWHHLQIFGFCHNTQSRVVIQQMEIIWHFKNSNKIQLVNVIIFQELNRLTVYHIWRHPIT